jgi:hypothetical protein
VGFYYSTWHLRWRERFHHTKWKEGKETDRPAVFVCILSALALLDSNLQRNKNHIASWIRPFLALQSL